MEENKMRPRVRMMFPDGTIVTRGILKPIPMVDAMLIEAAKERLEQIWREENEGKRHS